MQRRDFLALTGLTVGGLMVPSFLGKAIAAEQLQSTLDVAFKKRLADAARVASRLLQATPADPQLVDGMIARRGKVFLQPSAGWMAGFAGDQLFIIRFPQQERALIHPEQGQVELYLDDAPGSEGLLAGRVYWSGYKEDV